MCECEQWRIYIHTCRSERWAPSHHATCLLQPTHGAYVFSEKQRQHTMQSNVQPSFHGKQIFLASKKKIVFQISCCFLASSHLIRNRMQTDKGILLIFTHVLVSLSWFLLLYVQYTVLIMLNTCYADDVLKPNINVPSTKAIRLRTIVCCVFCVRSSITPN